MLHPPELIAKKRDGGELTPDEIDTVVRMYLDGGFADYQMSALFMAILLRGMTERETVALTLSMQRSGDTLAFEGLSGPAVDKHSTGGVGDKVSICLAPLVAACGAHVPMVCGRGLGHTGGTLDKLEAIPGFSVDLDPAKFCRQVRELGAAIMGQTERIAPADRRMYALRDVSATVESIPLITASILSKKLAEGIDALVLDVKTGRGAFMRERRHARALAAMLVRTGKRAGKRVAALLTDMSSPLGCTVGNALETREAIDVLFGRGPADVVECTLALGEQMLVFAGRAKNRAAGRSMLVRAIEDRSGARLLERLIEAQGGDPSVVEAPDKLPRAPKISELLSTRSGYVLEIDAREIGLSAVALGAGRARLGEPIDPAVGIELLKKRGDMVERGEPLARVHARGDDPAITKRIAGAYTLAQKRPRSRPLVIERIG